MNEEVMNIFFEIHQNIPREGPGDAESTQKAYAMIPDLPPQPQILDIGCGPGMQTMDLLNVTDGIIVALDNHQPFLDTLQRNVEKAGLAHRIEEVHGDMFSLDETFKKYAFDLLWSEGAIYIIGFETGLKTWKPLLKRDGYMAVSEISWLEPYIPKDVKTFWDQEYPAMQDIESNLKTIEETGYTNIGHFTLPESAWWTHYYIPLGKRLSMLRQMYQNNAAALKILDMVQAEIEMYRRDSQYYGYVFYIMQNNEC